MMQSYGSGVLKINPHKFFEKDLMCIAKQYTFIYIFASKQNNMTTLEKYIWLIGKLHTCNSNRRMTLAELNDAFKVKAGETIDRQKLKKWRDNIECIFNIIIKCDTKGREYRYYIENPEDIEGKSVVSWVLNSATVSNTLNTYKDLGDRIVCDVVPKGTKYLEPILQSMSEGIAVDITYRGVGCSEWTFRAEPYAVRQHHGQWYVLCKVNNLDSLIVYSLGQIKEVNLRNKDYFVIDATFDAQKYFEPFLGVVVNSNAECCRTVIRAYGNKIEYLRANPLHSSQKEIGGKDRVYADFEYNLMPTYDFANAVIGLGPMVEVMPFSPLRNEILNSIRAIKERYESENNDIEKATLDTTPALNGNFAVIEANVANGQPSSICSLSVVIVRDGKIVKKYHRFVKPTPLSFDKKMMDMNYITKNDVMNAPSFPEVWREIEHDISGLPLVGYNPSFEEYCLEATFLSYGMEWPGLKFHNALQASRHLFDKELSTKRLQTVAGASGTSATKEKLDSLSIAEEIATIALQVL